MNPKQTPALAWAFANLGKKTFEDVWELAQKKRKSEFVPNRSKQSRKYAFWREIERFCIAADDENHPQRYTRKFSTLTL